MALLAGDAGRLLRGSMLLIAGTMAGNVLNVVYTFLMARLLAPPDYAALVALISLFIVASLPAGTIQTVVAREVAIAEAAGDAGRPGAIVRRLLARLLPVALLASAGLLALASPAAGYLQVDDPTPLRVLALILGVLLLLPVLRGALQGRQRFGALAGLGLLDVLVKLVLGAVLVRLGYGVTGAFAAMLAGAVAGLALTAVALSHGHTAEAAAPDFAPLAPALEPAGPGPAAAVVAGGKSGWRMGLATLLALGGLNAMVTLDAVLVKHFFLPPEAGAYAAVSVLGRSLFWASGAITLVVLPLAARRSAAGRSAPPSGRLGAVLGGHELLWLSGAIVLGLGVVAQGLFTAVPGLLLALLFGSSYRLAAPLLPLYGWAALCLALANVAIYYLLGHGRAAPALIAPLGALLQVALIVALRQSLQGVIVALLVANAALLAASLVALVAAGGRTRGESQPVAEQEEQGSACRRQQ